MAVEESRLKIPLLFAFDTIHGFRTVFPIPLGTGASFDPAVASDDASYGARESAAVGIKQTYAPMVDVSHEPRWGRISEARRRGPVPELGDGRRARQGHPGAELQRARQADRQPEALRRVRAARGRARLQHHGHVRAAAVEHVPAAVQGRARRRRRHGDVLVQRDQRRAGLRQPPSDDRSPQGRLGLRRVRRERLDRRGRDARLPAEEPGPGRVRARGRGRRPRRGGARAERGRRLRDDEHADPRLRGAAARRRGASRWRGSTTRCAGSCASSSAPACSRTRTRRSRRRRPRRRC